jgi:hypothetical protein
MVNYEVFNDILERTVAWDWFYRISRISNFVFVDDFQIPGKSVPNFYFVYKSLMYFFWNTVPKAFKIGWKQDPCRQEERRKKKEVKKSSCLMCWMPDRFMGQEASFVAWKSFNWNFFQILVIEDLDPDQKPDSPSSQDRSGAGSGSKEYGSETLDESEKFVSVFQIRMVIWRNRHKYLL